MGYASAAGETESHPTHVKLIRLSKEICNNERVAEWIRRSSSNCKNGLVSLLLSKPLPISSSNAAGTNGIAKKYEDATIGEESKRDK